MPHSGFTDRAHSERLNAIRAALIERLRPICHDMPQEQFFEMVERMATLQLKYELQGVASAANG